MKTLTNEMIYKALYTRTTEEAQKALGDQDVFTIFSGSESSSAQGYVTLQHIETGVTFVVSQNLRGKSNLFNRYGMQVTKNHKSIKHYDFLNKIAVGDRKEWEALRQQRNTRYAGMAPSIVKYKETKSQVDSINEAIAKAKKELAELQKSQEREMARIDELYAQLENI